MPLTIEPTIALSAKSPVRLPLAGLLALAMTGFVAIMTETLPAGLLPQIGHDLHLSASLTGQLVTAYAVGSLLAAIPLTAVTQSWRRRKVLLLAIAGFLLFNTSTAFSSNYILTLVVRFLAGATAGLAWGIIAGYARRLVHEEQKGRAIAVAMAGTPIALSLGVPTATVLGRWIGWRSVFLMMSLMSIVLMVWVLWKLPDLPGQSPKERLSVVGVVRTPGVRPVLAVVFCWMVAHNILYTYVAPFLSLAKLSKHVDLVLLIFGISSIAGIWIIGFLVDRMLRSLLLTSLGVSTLSSIALGLGNRTPSIIYAAVIVWGLSFGGAATLLQTACAEATGKGADLAPSLVTTAWNMAIAGGGIVGGLLLSDFGPTSFPYAMTLLLLAAFGIAWAARDHGFTPGVSSSHSG